MTYKELQEARDTKMIMETLKMRINGSPKMKQMMGEQKKKTIITKLREEKGI